MNRLRISLLFFIALVSVLAATAEVRHFNVRNGLSNRLIYELEEDADGFIWIFTNSGIDRFDGHNFKFYALPESENLNTHTLSGSSMVRATDDSIYAGLRSGSIYRYDHTLDKFVKAFTITNVSLYHLLPEPDGSLIVSTDKGVYRCIEGQEPVCVALEGEFINCTESDGHGHLYAGTRNGVVRITPREAWRTELIKDTEGISVKSLAVAADRLYIGPFDSPVKVVELATGRVSPMPFTIPPVPVNSMCRFGDHSLLIGVNGAGVYQVDAATGRLTRHYHDSTGDKDAISGNGITSILVDRDSGLWIGTSHTGLNYKPLKDNAVRVFKPERGNPNSIVSGYINCVFEDRDGDLWFGTDKGVSCREKTTGKWRHYLRDDLRVNVILGLGQSSDGRIWISSYGGGVNTIDKSTGKVTKIPERSGDKGVATRYVFTAHVDDADNVWLGGINGDVTRYNIKSDKYTYYPEDCIASVVSDGTRGILLGGNYGVGTYNAVNDKIVWQTDFDTISITYPVRSLCVDAMHNQLWIGTTGNGLVRYDRATGKARRYTTVDGLSSNSIYDVMIDLAGFVWIVTETDIYRYNRRTDKISSFSHLLNLDGDAFTPNAAETLADGNLLLGTSNGAILFDPLVGLNEVSDDRIIFTDFKVNDRTAGTGTDSPLDVNIDLTSDVTLSNSQNSIEIGFGVINHSSPYLVGFEYKLSCVDKEFHPAGSIHSARYNQLEPGKYTFTVRAVDYHTDRIVAERSISIRVRQPLWLSWWACIGYFLVIAALIVFAVGYLRRRASERRIEAQIKSFAALAHDIRTPMSMVQGPLLNMELDKDLNDTTRRNLTQARKAIDKTMGLLSEMLELRHHGNGGRPLAVSKTRLADFLAAKAEEYRMMAVFKGLNLECDVDSTLGEIFVDKDVLNHIVDNLLSNAIKYTSSGTVRLEAQRAGRKNWRLIVSDTGIGIAKPDAHHIFRHRHRSPQAVATEKSGLGVGLLITKRLVVHHRGTITFTSKAGEGSTFTVTLPLDYPEKYIAKPVEVKEPESAESPEVETTEVN
ncbi:MAG: hypothetical protein K2M55_08725, partial [Muribaculaceae bacterium]|nr:hypothetical protein [Muribaculaceae bacterium]